MGKQSQAGSSGHAFKSVDKNLDGKVSRSEFTAQVEQQGAKLVLAKTNATKAPTLFDRVDLNNDGFVTEYEWYQAQNAKVLAKVPPRAFAKQKVPRVFPQKVRRRPFRMQKTPRAFQKQKMRMRAFAPCPDGEKCCKDQEQTKYKCQVEDCDDELIEHEWIQGGDFCQKLEEEDVLDAVEEDEDRQKLEEVGDVGDGQNKKVQEKKEGQANEIAEKEQEQDPLQGKKNYRMRNW